MDKRKIIKIVSISLVFLLIAIIFPLNLTYGSFNKTANLIMTKEYELLDEININTMDSNIEVIPADIDKIKVNIYDKSDKEIEITNKNNKLTISNNKECKNCERSKVLITVPSNYNGIFNLKTISGDINIDKADRIKINTISGNILINNVSNLTSETTSGNLAIESLNGYIEHKTNTGDVAIVNAYLNEESTIETVSGAIKIDNTNNLRIKVTSFNSQATVNSNRNSNTILNVKSYSGIIDIK